MTPLQCALGRGCGRLLARSCACEPWVALPHGEVDLDDVGCRLCPACGQGRRRDRVGSVGAVAELGGMRRQRGGVRSEVGDLEREGRRALQLLLECEVPARVAARPRVPQGRERPVPGFRVGEREVRGALPDRKGLRRKAFGLRPGGLGRTCGHRHQPGGKGDGERGRRPPAWRTGRLEPLEERAQGDVEVALGRHDTASLRPQWPPILDFGLVPLYLTESDVAALLTPADAVEAIEESFRRQARGGVAIAPRRRLRLPEGALADMAAADSGLGLAGGKLYAATAEGVAFAVCLFDDRTGELVAVIAADHLGRLRTGAASAVAARHLARPGAATLGVIGCGDQAETQIECIRAALSSIERVVAFCRSRERLEAFCQRLGAEPGESHRDAGSQDVVVTITTSRDPVLRGEWLPPGALVVAAGANVPSRRELDNAVLERASFVCCDSLEQARLESGDLIEPVAAGVLDWLEVHELHEVVGGEVAGRQSDRDIVVFKSNGIAAWDVAIGGAAIERARERGAGTQL